MAAFSTKTKDATNALIKTSDSSVEKKIHARVMVKGKRRQPVSARLRRYGVQGDRISSSDHLRERLSDRSVVLVGPTSQALPARTTIEPDGKSDTIMTSGVIGSPSRISDEEIIVDQGRGDKYGGSAARDSVFLTPSDHEFKWQVPS